jgi:alkylation response protein AidB-like acyl-CoA dehydrogenase
MDFRLNEEEKLIRETAAQFVRREMLTREQEYLRQAELFLPPGDPPLRTLDPEIYALLGKIARRIGLWAPELPASADEGPMSAVARVLVYREFGRCILPFEPVAIPLLMAGSPYGKPLREGKLSLSLAFDQIHKTGTIEGVKATYREVSDGYVLSDGRVNAVNPAADIFLLPAREESAERAGLFLISRDTPGITIDDVADLTSDAAVAALTLNQFKLLKERLLGGKTEISAVIASEQLRIAARCLGIAMRCLADAIEHARHRVTFGRPLAQRQAIQWMIADLSTDISISTWLTLEAAWRADHYMPYFQAAALAKKRAAKTAFQAADTAIQIHGGYGVCKEFPFEGFYREARMMRLLYGQEAEMDRAAGNQFFKEGIRQ